MNFFERRRLKKAVKHLLHEARHVRHMREDVADPGAVQALERAERELSRAWTSGDRASIEAASDQIGKRIVAVRPEPRDARIREFMEIVVVALAAAMALRAYFVQPFKIPTGSMQPSLYGITHEPAAEPGFFDRAPLNLVKLFLTGTRFVAISAAEDGIVRHMQELGNGNLYILAGNREYEVFRGMALRVREGDLVRKGQPLASGIRKSGDHIFVDKVSYNFRRPRRGDVFVFNTEHIRHPQIQADTFYIKRLAALPGDTVQIQPPFLVINGERMTEPGPIARVESARDGYHGYQLAAPMQSLLNRPDARLLMGPGEYLPLGDNTRSSLDGRYFGSVRAESIVGPAFVVYWPFTSRWGRVD